MAIESDVLVVGGGFAGMASAVAATHEGTTVRLASHRKTTLRQASGLVDAPSYVPSRDSAAGGADYVTQGRADSRAVRSNRDAYQGPLVRPTDRFDDLLADYPHSLAGESALRNGLALFDDLTGDAYHGGHTDRNALLPTFGDAMKPTARYPRAAAEGLASDDRPMLVVDFRSFADFDARMLADSLEAAGTSFPAADVEIKFAEEFRADAPVTRIAKVLDHDGRLDGTPVRRTLVDVVKPYVDRAERVGSPAVPGDDCADAVRAVLLERLGVDVFEISMGPPSLPDLRLEDRLYDALNVEGILYETGNPIVGYETDGESGHVDAVLVDRKGREVPYAADSFVLAADGLVGKGLDSDRMAVREPVFDCRVPQPSGRYDWFVDDAFGAHPYAHFGIEPDAKMRPLATDRTSEFENLFTAGAVVGDADAAREKSAAGVSLAASVVAGRGAAKELED